MTAPSTQETAAAADVPTELTDGYHLVVDALKMNDVDTIYGVVGIPITDLARLAQAQGIRYIGFRHESNAGHAAAAAGYLTKKPGVALTVSAPGFLNGLVALANATTNCFPMVQISGSSERHLVDLKQGDYEEMDQLAAAQPFVKAAYRVSRVEDIGRGIARALRTAISGRPGGVYLDIPAAVLGAILPKAEGDRTLSRLVDPAPRQLPAPEAVDRAIELLASAERPLVVLGKGAAYAQADDKVREFIESTGIPYVPMSMAKGLLPDDHPQSAATARSLALKKADVVMLIGARLNWLLGHGQAGWNPDAKFVQIDIDPKEMDSNQPIAAPLVGDIESVLDALAERTKPGQIQAPSAWRDELGARSAQNVAKMAQRTAADPHPMQFMGALKAVRDVIHARPETYLVNEGANALDIARNVIDMHVPRHRLDSGTWGVMGIGMGYAIAAAVERTAGRGRRGRQRLRVQRHRDRDDLPLPAPRRHRDHEQRRRLPRRRHQPVRRRPLAHHPHVGGPPRPPHRGVRRQGLPRHHPRRGHRRPHRGPRLRRPGAHRLRDRPLGRHRERPHLTPQPQGHHRRQHHAGQEVTARTTASTT